MAQDASPSEHMVVPKSTLAFYKLHWPESWEFDVPTVAIALSFLHHLLNANHCRRFSSRSPSDIDDDDHGVGGIIAADALPCARTENTSDALEGVTGCGNRGRMAVRKGGRGRGRRSVCGGGGGGGDPARDGKAALLATTLGAGMIRVLGGAFAG